MNIDLTGWTHVHTWHESHGKSVAQFYQRTPNARMYTRTVETLVITSHRNGSPDHVAVEHDRDYLMARDIQENPTRYVANGAHHTEPCCTAGYDDWHDLETGDLWRIMSVAGHGKWAFKLPEENT